MKAEVMNTVCTCIVAFVLSQGCGEAKQSIGEPDVVETGGAVKAAETVAEDQTTDVLPGWAEEVFLAQSLNQKYSLGAWMQPNILTGDFDGDKQEDVAFLIVNRATDEKGLMILYHDKGNNYSVFGAGTEFEDMRNMDWIEIFERVDAGQTVAPTLVDEETGDILGEDLENAVLLKSDAIFVHLAEACGGGIIYKKENGYGWINIE
ncbi:hypothetical protein [Pontibacter litorisediminis]|uniref:hypothetical protein n=1 Tax=Pontibacter litorisediminis TaxID=1846260 RepID=UPI0023EBDF15|nr:hypothetical protein [Pontibacter litorisediminis]